MRVAHTLRADGSLVRWPRAPGLGDPQHNDEDTPASHASSGRTGVGRLHAVVLDLLVRADGSVGEATVLSSTDKALEPLALAAVRQWRYKPIAEDQPHAVQMVFRQ